MQYKVCLQYALFTCLWYAAQSLARNFLGLIDCFALRRCAMLYDCRVVYVLALMTLHDTQLHRYLQFCICAHLHLNELHGTAS